MTASIMTGARRRVAPLKRLVKRVRRHRLIVWILPVRAAPPDDHRNAHDAIEDAFIRWARSMVMASLGMSLLILFGWAVGALGAG